MTTPPEAALVGPGAIGSFFAAQLARATKAHVTVCARTAFDTLTVQSELWSETIEVAPDVVTSVGELAAAPVDWVFLATKAHQTASAAPWLDRLCGARTTVVVLQNGVEQVERVRPLVRRGTAIVPTVVHCGAERQAPGRIVHRTNGFLVVPSDRVGRARRLAGLFDATHQIVRPTEDFLTEAWKKLCTNVAANGITALTGRRVGVLREAGARSVAGALLDECVRVARANGAQLPDAYAETVLERITSMPEAAGTSMLYDRLAGRALESDAIYGAVVRAGRRAGIPTPATEQINGLLAALQAA